MLIDWSRIESLIDGDDPSDLEWIQDMIQTLYENMVTRIENVKKFSDNREAESLRSELHQIKGVSANFGLKQLYEMVLDAESKVKEGNLEEGIALSIKVPAVWEETKLELQKKYP